MNALIKNNFSRMILSGALSSVLILFAAHAYSALPNGTIYTIEQGSFFTIGSPTDVLGENNIVIGADDGDTGSGSHSGCPVPGDIGAVDKPWCFFNGTGYDYIFPGFPVVEVAPNELDFRGWTVTWSGAPRIPMGGCFLVTGGCDSNGDGIDDNS